MLTSDQLIARVLRRCYWPADPNTGLCTAATPFSNADVLAIADEELAGRVFPEVVKADGAYYQHTLDYAITTAQQFYRLPSVNFGPLVDVTYIDDSWPDGRSIPMMTTEELGHVRRSWSGSRGDYFHFFQGDYVGLTPTPEETFGTLRITYMRPPNQLVNVSSTAKITGFFSNTTLALDTDLRALLTTTPTVDTVGAGNAHQLSSIATAVTLSVALGINLAAQSGNWDQTKVSVGDSLALTGFTSIVQIPQSAEAWFILLVTSACLRARKQLAESELAAADAGSIYSAMLTALIPRSNAEPKYTVVRNSPLRIMGRGWR